MNETGRTREMAAGGSNFIIEKEVFQLYIAHACINILKMIFVAYYTVFKRFANKTFSTKEDYEGFAATMEKDDVKKKLAECDPEVERVRSCHRNDLENIPAFLVVGLLYALTNPGVDAVSLHFRVFTLCRIIHTMSYLLPLPQPSRFLGFSVGTLSMVSMAIQTLLMGKL
uniref:Microsomal glutathione S-transferase 1 n=1 Tax=Stichopus japonicus TaxID=307972 RepID=A0A2L0RIB9_STIJA|nr:microsomal glutathione transferase 1 [Apostichopus japonicus]